MSNTKSSNQTAVPEAKGALDRFKFEVANELGVPLTDGYNGNLTSKQNGSVGGYMVKKIVSEQPLNFNSIFYTHTRIGKNGKEFELYKFRSMVPNSKEMLEEIQGMKDELRRPMMLLISARKRK